jgi:ElaB/YqjD/DUF883 family membrane-anchored ribosome-binding protein
MSIKDSTSKAGEAVRESYRATRARAEEAYETAVAGRRTADTVENNPLAALVGGLGVGMLIGALLPRTRRETELLGSYGSEITTRAREAAEAARTVGQEKLDELGFVKDTARETAQKVMDGAKAAASEAGSAAARKARGED